jgi:quercetin dioxygenase-like cupin family protein
MRTRTTLAVTACLVAAAVGGIPNRIAASDADFIRLRPEEIHWQDIPGGHGAQLATLAGDPSGNGLYIQRVRFPPHVMDRPHWHPNDRHVTVLSGTWFTGTGGTFDPRKAVPLKAGSYMLHPARALHWDGSNSDEEVIVQIVGIGPAKTVQANPGQPFWVQLKQ